MREYMLQQTGMHVNRACTAIVYACIHAQRHVCGYVSVHKRCQCPPKNVHAMPYTPNKKRTYKHKLATGVVQATTWPQMSAGIYESPASCSSFWCSASASRASFNLAAGDMLLPPLLRFVFGMFSTGCTTCVRHVQEFDREQRGCLCVFHSTPATNIFLFCRPALRFLNHSRHCCSGIVKFLVRRWQSYIQPCHAGYNLVLMIVVFAHFD
jgi:hypothetical protein